MSDQTMDGVRVLDLTTFVTGGFATLMLANQGAEVTAKPVKFRSSNTP